MKRKIIAALLIVIVLIGILTGYGLATDSNVVNLLTNRMTGSLTDSESQQAEQGTATSNQVSLVEIEAEQAVLEAIELPVSLEGLTARETQTPWEGTQDELVLRSVGDVLIHDRVSWLADKESPVYQEAVAILAEEGIWQEDADSAARILAGEAHDLELDSSEYDFLPMLARIAPFTTYADVTIANLEVIAAYPQLPVAGYPQFNAPASILEALRTVGIDIVSNGTNHTLDWFSEGAQASLDNLNEAGLMYTGSYGSVEDFQTPRIIEKNGISIGFLTYSYGTNGISVPEGEEYLISLVDIPTMVDEVAWLKPQVDAVIVTLQLGPEYGEMPDDIQLEVFQTLADSGVKLILGGHPHVLQPMAWLNEDETFAIYSQASFLSGQRDLDNKQGGITEITFKRNQAGEVVVTEPKFMPIFMLGVEAEKMYEVVPMADYNKFAIPEGEFWYDTIDTRMHTFTDEFEYVTHLETEWTEEAKGIHR